MHEYHIVEGIVKQILQKATSCSATRVTSVSLVLGAQSGLEQSSVAMYFENLTQGTLAQGASLTFKPVKAKLTCTSCKLEFERTSDSINCPKCCSMGLLNQTGTEFYIENIEIETNE